ncbi:NADPH-dependent 7-cyano-7-deazaguanine reductase QueF [Desulfuromonas thiophila]|uniref:NADPH-dependent 7-cyano-7-deazaguanine reductase QueF n=1 Tax=Desulfuromonas thiophila TaxID=57664 RepID=UPI0024A9D16E|nr:NADPH-dependent 7-cyano-7-deazaguanine reductase QueF [Desulfuromonas thiophila]
MNPLEHLPLGQPTRYADRYDSGLLCPVPRQLKRAELGIGTPLPFVGEDLWNGYELSWLNPKGKPVVALLQLRVPCHSPNLIESKSLKLYLNSYNQTAFATTDAVADQLRHDLSAVAGTAVTLNLSPPDDVATWQVGQLTGQCLDDLDIAIDRYQVDSGLLSCSPAAPEVEEQLYSHLLKSNCLITSQPDWASLWLQYRGPAIDHAGLLRYLISFRQHNEFHEQCVERIFTDVLRCCRPTQLSVYARYTRRGGLDINPWRSTDMAVAPNWRLARQ